MSDVNAVEFSPDGKSVVTGSHDGVAKVWDAAPGQPAGWSHVHKSKVTDLAISPDGRRIATGCGDGLVRL